MLGHSDIRMTLAIYTHATDGMQDAGYFAAFTQPERILRSSWRAFSR
jgi:hypothetical protein